MDLGDSYLLPVTRICNYPATSVPSGMDKTDFLISLLNWPWITYWFSLDDKWASRVREELYTQRVDRRGNRLLAEPDRDVLLLFGQVP